jgi:orotidine 5'-phosphate decarboxylase subfamily 2
MNFIEKFERRREKVKNVLIVGLDTNVEKLPSDFSKDAQGVYEYNKKIIEMTKEIACAYKINSAFYEMLGPAGMEAMMKTREMIDDEIPIIYDCKRGDISSTAEAYAKAAFDFYKFDAVTLSPYMGWDGVKPFTDYEDKYAFLVCLSSNKSAADFEYHGNPPLYVEVATSIASFGNKCGLVVGATVAKALEEIHEIAPNSLILVPGVGTQGGSAKDVMNSSARDQVLVNVSRAIIFAEDPRKAAEKYAEELRWERSNENSSKKEMN